MGHDLSTPTSTTNPSHSSLSLHKFHSLILGCKVLVLASFVHQLKNLKGSRIINQMVDYHTVCSMCGDVGFPDKLFRCTKCHNRFQHSYCSSYYSESSEPIEVCDWCRSEERNARHGGASRKSGAVNDGGSTNRSEYSGERIKQHDREEGSERGKNPSGTPSPRPATRRYKLLKDVMC